MAKHQRYAIEDFSVDSEFGPLAGPNDPIFLVDMDGVLVDLEGHIYERWAELHPNEPLIPREERTEFYMDFDHPKSYHSRMREIYKEPGCFRYPKPMPDAKAGMEFLEEFGSVFICTSPMFSNPTCVPDKIRWIQKHIGQRWTDRILITKDKTAVRGTHLLDDRPRIDGKLVPEWEHIVFAHAYNINCPQRRAVDWDHYCDIVAAEFPQLSS